MEENGSSSGSTSNSSDGFPDFLEKWPEFHRDLIAKEREWRRRGLFDAVTLVAFILLLLSISVVISGYYSLYGWPITFAHLMADFYANVSAELLSIGLTVLLIDRLSAKRNERSEIDNLIHQLGNSRPEFAREAYRRLEFGEYFWNKKLHGVTISRSDLNSAELDQASLRKVFFLIVLLRKAILTRSKLENSSWVMVDLTDANISNANLTGSSFFRCIAKSSTMVSTDLRFVSMEEIYLQNADLSRAKLTNSKFDSCDFSNANLKGADLSGAKFSECRFVGTIYDLSTKWPEGFEPVAHGAVSKE